VSTELCTHLASHGYVVASPDFPADNLADLVQTAGGGGASRRPPNDQVAVNRRRDVVFVLDRVVGGAEPALASVIDPDRVGTCGHSFGGWTTIAANSLDPRPKASFAMAPTWWGSGGPAPEAEAVQALTRLDDWGRPVPAFLLAGEHDSLQPLRTMRELYRDMPPPKRLAVLGHADHMHFVDTPEQIHELFRTIMGSGTFPDHGFDAPAIAAAMGPFAALCPAAHAIATVRALCLAHMDTHLKGNAAARAFLDGDLAGTFATRGIDLEAAKQNADRSAGASV
jgi:dienelactone hydrolase